MGTYIVSIVYRKTWPSNKTHSEKATSPKSQPFSESGHTTTSRSRIPLSTSTSQFILPSRECSFPTLLADIRSRDSERLLCHLLRDSWVPSLSTVETQVRSLRLLESSSRL